MLFNVAVQFMQGWSVLARRWNVKIHYTSDSSCERKTKNLCFLKIKCTTNTFLLRLSFTSAAWNLILVPVFFWLLFFAYSPSPR